MGGLENPGSCRGKWKPPSSKPIQATKKREADERILAKPGGSTSLFQRFKASVNLYHHIEPAVILQVSTVRLAVPVVPGMISGLMWSEQRAAPYHRL